MSRTLRVLIVEDNPADAEMILRELRRASYDPQWERVDSESEYLARLESGLDVILSDYTMPNFSGRRALTLLQERGLDLPFIIISGTIGEDLAVEVMRQGAADYLLKDRLARLGPAVALGLEKRRLRKQNESAGEALRQSEYKYRHLFESLNEAALLIDCTSRRILDLNHRAEELLGRPRGEVLGMDELKLFAREAATAFGGLTTAATTPHGQRRDLEILTKDNAPVPVQVSVTSLVLNGRQCVLALMTDTVARNQKDKSFRMAKQAVEASLLEGGMLTNMTRQIRSPMSGLVGVLDALLDEIPAPRREMVESGRLAAISLLKILDESEQALRDAMPIEKSGTVGEWKKPLEFHD